MYILNCMVTQLEIQADKKDHTKLLVVLIDHMLIIVCIILIPVQIIGLGQHVIQHVIIRILIEWQLVYYILTIHHLIVVTLVEASFILQTNPMER